MKMARTRLAAPILLAALVAIGAPHGAAGRNKPPSTTLLFSLVTNAGGLDTGIAIANTSADPFGTTPLDGTCTLSFFGGAAPAPTTTPEILAGTVHTFLASTTAPGFQGYMVAECNFPLAHGLAFVSDIGVGDFAMTSLALVIPPRGRKSGERLGN
jgi:hypothetical protein